ncbi:MAG TPA: YdbH domain-containing protein [Arenibaculum sp.]|nr:YdbH domain-containing protein [Arenibaculum sp.]
MTRFRWGVIASAVTVLLLLGGGLVLAVIEAPRVLEVLATRALRDAGFPEATAELDRLGLGGAGMRVVLDPGTGDRLGTVNVGWSLRGLLAFELDRLDVRDSDVSVRMLPDGTAEIAGLPLGTASPERDVGGAPAPAWDLPLREAALHDAVLRVEGGPVPVVMTVDAVLRRIAPEEDGAEDGAEEGAEEGGAGGRIRFSATAHGSAGSARIEVSGALSELDGVFRVDLENLPLPGGEISSARLAGTVTLAPDAVAVSSHGPWLLAGRLPETWTDDADPLLQGPLSATIRPPDEGRVTLTWRTGEAGSRAEFGAAVRIEGGQGERIDLRAGRAAVSWTDAGIETLDIDALTLSTSELRIGGAYVSVPRLALDISGSAGEGRGRLGFEFGVAGTFPGGVSVEDGRVSADGALGWSGNRATFDPDSCLQLAAAGIRTDILSAVLPAGVCVRAMADRPPLLSADLGGIAVEGTLAVPELAFTLSSPGGDPTRIEASVPALDLAFAADWAGGVRTLAAAFADGSVVLPDHAVTAAGIRANVEVGAGEPGEMVADLRVARLSHGARPAFVGPLSASLTAHGRLDGAVDLAGEVSGVVTGRVRGRHDIVSGIGSVRVEVPPLLLGPGGKSLDEVSPWLARQVENAAGTVGLDLRAGWGPGGGGGGPTQGAELLLRDVSFVAGSVAVEGLSTVLRAGGLMPLVLPPGQEVAVGVIDVGVPLTNGLIRFGIGSNGRLDVGQAAWDWAGGVVRAQPFSLDLAAPEGMVVLRAERLDLARLLEVLPVEGLTGTGTLAGSLPVRVVGNTVGVVQGSLVAVAPGTLRYLPEQPPDFLTGEGGAEMLLDALTDFRYEALALAMDGTAGGEMVVGLKIRGANPDFYDGYPVALNLNVSGALDTILRRGLSAYRIPEAVRERMIEFENRVE